MYQTMKSKKFYLQIANKDKEVDKFVTNNDSALPIN